MVLPCITLLPAVAELRGLVRRLVRRGSLGGGGSPGEGGFVLSRDVEAEDGQDGVSCRHDSSSKKWQCTCVWTMSHIVRPDFPLVRARVVEDDQGRRGY